MVHGREVVHRKEDNLQIKVCNLIGMSQRVVFIVVDLDILLKTVIRRKVMRLGINITHSGHYAEKYSNQDLRLFIASDDIDEPPNFDS